METRCTLETKCGFLSWQSDDGVLNFLSGCSPHGILLIVHGLLSRRRTTSPMPKSLFGTDGIRGVPGTPPLDDATLYATGRALGSYLQQAHPAARVLRGADTRESGLHIAALLAAGLSAAGASVAFAGVITTPG